MDDTNDPLVERYRDCDIRTDRDGWYYAAKLTFGSTEYLCGSPGNHYWGSDYSKHCTTYGPSSIRDDIDSLMGEQAIPPVRALAESPGKCAAEFVVCPKCGKGQMKYYTGQRCSGCGYFFD